MPSASLIYFIVSCGTIVDMCFVCLDSSMDRLFVGLTGEKTDSSLAGATAVRSSAASTASCSAGCLLRAQLRALLRSRLGVWLRA